MVLGKDPACGASHGTAVSVPMQLGSTLGTVPGPLARTGGLWPGFSGCLSWADPARVGGSLSALCWC